MNLTIKGETKPEVKTSKEHTNLGVDDDDDDEVFLHAGVEEKHSTSIIEGHDRYTLIFGNSKLAV